MLLQIQCITHLHTIYAINVVAINHTVIRIVADIMEMQFVLAILHLLFVKWMQTSMNPYILIYLMQQRGIAALLVFQ